MYGGLLEEVGPAQTQEQADANARALGIDVSKPPSRGLFNKVKNGLSAFSRKSRPATPPPPITDAVMGPQTREQFDAANNLANYESVFGNKPPSTGLLKKSTNILSAFSRRSRPATTDGNASAAVVDASASASAATPPPPPSPPAATNPSATANKIKPDNLLVPMVINLEKNYVLVGAGIFKIENDGNVSKQYIKNAYDIYIKQATQSLSTAMPSNEQIKVAVRDMVTDEFKGKIRQLLDSGDLESKKLASVADQAIELGMGELFYKIRCIILSETLSNAEIAAINSLIEGDTEQEAQKLEKKMLERPVDAVAELKDLSVTIPTGNPGQENKPSLANASRRVISTNKASNAFGVPTKQLTGVDEQVAIRSSEEAPLDAFGVGKLGESVLPEDMNERYKTFFEKHKYRTFYQLNSKKDKLYLCTLIDPIDDWFDKETRDMRFRRTDGNIGSVNNYYAILPIKSDNNLPKPLADVVDAYLPNGDYSISDDNVDDKVRIELACVFGNRECLPVAMDEFLPNASKQIEKEEGFEGGARSKKTRKRRQKRSKRKTVHYLRKHR
jgi:hypothetical protein